jgi:hypothetical protein
MSPLTLEAHAGTTVVIDLCAGCQAFWFDKFETLKLAPASTLRLFALVGEHAAATRKPFPDALPCPRCRTPLAPTRDMQRATRFRYWRCPRNHGRLTTFVDFLREKDFIRPLSSAQVDEMRKHLQTVHCSSCGAPIDLAHRSSCSHCGSPLSMLDFQQAERVVAQLRDASIPKPVDPALPLELARARREVEAAFAGTASGVDWWRDVSSSGVVEASLAAVVRWWRRAEG